MMTSRCMRFGNNSDHCQGSISRISLRLKFKVSQFVSPLIRKVNLGKLEMALFTTMLGFKSKILNRLLCRDNSACFRNRNWPKLLNLKTQILNTLVFKTTGKFIKIGQLPRPTFSSLSVNCNSIASMKFSFTKRTTLMMDTSAVNISFQLICSLLPLLSKLKDQP